MPFRTVWVLLPFKHWWWQSFSELTTEEHRGCILTDALSFLHAMTNNTMPHLANVLQLLNNNCRVALKWILAKCGVPGNEQGETLTKQGAQTEQPCVIVSYQELATITKALMITCQAKGAYHSRPEQVIMVRLRIEHNRWNAHMHKELTMVPLAACLFGEEDLQTTEHILQNCKRHDQERSSASPT